MRGCPYSSVCYVCALCVLRVCCVCAVCVLCVLAWALQAIVCKGPKNNTPNKLQKAELQIRGNSFPDLMKHQTAKQTTNSMSKRIQTGVLIQWMEEILHHLDQLIENLPVSFPLTPGFNIGPVTPHAGSSMYMNPAPARSPGKYAPNIKCGGQGEAGGEVFNKLIQVVQDFLHPLNKHSALYPLSHLVCCLLCSLGPPELTPTRTRKSNEHCKAHT